jgi:hypothetical protein
LVTVLAAAVLCAAAGSAVLTSSAFAGDVDSNGFLNAAVYNSTPYTMSLVRAESIPTGDCVTGCWYTQPAQTLAPGAGSLFQLGHNVSKSYLFSDYYGFDGYFTYRVDVVGGAPEYITVAISQAQSNGIYGNNVPAVDVWNTPAPPPAGGYDPAVRQPPFGTQTANPQLAYAHETPTHFDQTITLTGGNYMIDASTPQGQPFVELLNGACGGANASCAFTQSTLTYGPGQLTLARQFQECVGGGGGSGNNAGYDSVTYAASQSAGLSVGGGLTTSAELSVFGAVSLGASISIDAEKQWEDTVTVSRTAEAYMPANSIGFIWVSPTVGTIRGTLVATIGGATFTAKNFSEVRSGVPGPGDPLKDPTPAFNAVVKVRPMTASEKSQWCGFEATKSRLGAPRASTSTPPARIVPGRSVSQVALGDSPTTVLRRLGRPAVRSFPLRPCQGMPGCSAVPGLLSTFEYKKRKLSVVFGPDGRVTALVYSGPLTTKTGVGLDDSMARLRAEFPRILCAKSARRVDCSVSSGSGAQTVRTVFQLTDRLRGAGTYWLTNKVLIYVSGAGKVKA